jgi:hypothetical protein
MLKVVMPLWPLVFRAIYTSSAANNMQQFISAEDGKYVKPKEGRWYY